MGFLKIWFLTGVIHPMSDPVKAKILARRDTTENWNTKTEFVPMRGEIIIYTDHATIKDDFGIDINVPGVKIGDGNAYLIDLPFVGDEVRYQLLMELRRHEENPVIHVTQGDRDFWNAKLNYIIDGKTLVFNRD